MSFRLMVCFCAVCGAGGGVAGWALGRWAAGEDSLLRAGVKAMLLGASVAAALSLADDPDALSTKRVGALLPRAMAAAALGAVGGLFGGLLGDRLYETSERLGFVVGWALTGTLIGAAPGALDLAMATVRRENARGPRRKALVGGLGGLAGGVAGGLLSQAVRSAWTDVFASRPAGELWSPSAFGFVALGGCIGLMAGLAQVVLKEAWLRVETGRRAGREVLLSRPTLTVGRAETCDLGLFGDPSVERLHARLVRHGDDYVLCDAGTAAGTFVNDERLEGPRVLRSGDAIRVGDHMLRFGERRTAD